MSMVQSQGKQLSGIPDALVRLYLNLKAELIVCSLLMGIIGVLLGSDMLGVLWGQLPMFPKP